MLLSQEFPEVGSQGETLQECCWNQVQSLGPLTWSLTESGGVEVREIKASHDRSQRGVSADVREEFPEDAGVRDGDLAVQRGESCGVDAT